jgi:hypothetical protein
MVFCRTEASFRYSAAAIGHFEKGGGTLNIRILQAAMKHDEQNGYLGNVGFQVEGHKQPYEITLQSDRKPDDWNYSIHFLSEPGSEEQLDLVERAIEEDDELFDALVEAALETAESK